MPDTMQYRRAEAADVETIAALEKRFGQDELSTRERVQGLQGQGFSAKELEPLVAAGHVWLALAEGRVIGYLISGNWDKLKHSPLCQALSRQLAQGRVELGLNWQQTLHYGPVWVHPDYRGKGVFGKLYCAARAEISGPWLALIAEDNEASLRAHSRAGRMQTLDFVTLCGRDFYLLLG
ncbi:GNAT family N-acetyltransferase [Shewanella algae]|uniref:GNAT family N-acetyltransferase n=1 Tax=Shewanella algae TaxID=38313 RepID=UPI001F290D9A|nr:GNAT family N-acetyltransferase [Shewanella algae]MCE9780743.1 GNAT family N-acetyltransferase [Shewanella algae]MCE9825502.1 GNAT family N-acetyltransferase [Shewanella algae]